MATAAAPRCDCGKVFKDADTLKQHKDAKAVFVCPICCDDFSSRQTLEQHAEAKKHNIKGDGAKRRQTYVSNLYQQINPESADRKVSAERVRDIMKKITGHVRSQSGGKIYSADLRKAGSHAANVKIGKADEFDWNVDINVKIESLITEGTLLYQYEDKLNPQAEGAAGTPSPKNMNLDRKLVDTTTRHIPVGYATVKLVAGQVPESCLYKGNFIPHKLLKDLYEKLKAALKDLGMTGIDLSPISHGPALTFTIKPGGHHISSDLTATLPCDLDVTSQGWPRRQTRAMLSDDRIRKVKEAGMHLVPKGDEVWCISYSKCEKALLDGVDSGNECRKMCHQLMKRYVQIFSSKMSASGISSYIFKHQLFWMNEQSTKGSEYWKQSNFANCLLDMLDDTATKLKSGKINNYFDERINILAKKDRGLINKLANFLQNERDRLMHI